jgi:methionyl aminopeptidase
MTRNENRIRAVASILRILSSEIKARKTTRHLDEIATSKLERHGTIPSFKGYRGLPAALCVSINDEVVHDIPPDRVIQESDLL